MKIEVLVRWTEAQFSSQPQDETDRIINGERKQTPKIFYDFSPMVIDVRDISRFNRANDPNFTTLRMVDGEGYVISYPYKDFIARYMELTGSYITCILPDDYETEEDIEDSEDDEI